jgi:hypothetical protein
MRRYKKHMIKGGYVPTPQDAKELADWNELKTIGKNIAIPELSTDTMRFYRNGLTIVVVIRGTRIFNARDHSGNFMISSNRINETERYKIDRIQLLRVQQSFPHRTTNNINDNGFSYYGIGHSKGGALLDRFIEEGLIDAGISFNPAIEPKNLIDTTGLNRRIYNENDKLNKWFGQKIVPTDIPILPGTQSEGPEILANKIKGPFKELRTHLLSSFDPKEILRVDSSPPTSPRPTQSSVELTENPMRVMIVPNAQPLEDDSAAGVGLGKYNLKRFSYPDVHIKHR